MDLRIPGYKPGDDITILSNWYQYAKRDSNGDLMDDVMTIVYRDNNTGEKKFIDIKNPKYEYWQIKPEFVKEYNQFLIEKEKCEPVVVPYKDLEKDISEKLGISEFFYENIRQGNRRANQIVHTHPTIMGSDFQIEDYYRKIFARTFKNTPYAITKAYLDIEVDVKYAMADFPEPGECPINVTSLYNEVDNTLYTFILRDKRNKSLLEFEEYLKTHDFHSEFIAFLDKHLGGWKQRHRMKLADVKTTIVFFDEEIEMLASVFRVINATKPDFVLAWNMAFDIPYIIARIQVLGYDPIEIMCHPNFTYRPKCEYFIDKMHESTLDTRGDYATISSYSVYMDQMIQFPSRRRGQAVMPAYTLDYIGRAVAKCGKLDYRTYAPTFAKFPYYNFRWFVIYNMVDVLTQKCVEVMTEDINYIYGKALANDTRYHKAHRQTVYLYNRTSKFLFEHGWILRNNINKFKEVKDFSYEGAFVASPTKISDDNKERVNGKPIMLFRDDDDFDFKRLYPSITQEFNITDFTQIGRLNLPEKMWENENRRNNPKFYRATQFIEDYCSGDRISFMHRWFGLASFVELATDINDYFSTQANVVGEFQPMLSQYGKKNVLRPWVENTNIPVLKEYNGEKLNVLVPYVKMPDEIRDMSDKIVGEIEANGSARIKLSDEQHWSHSHMEQIYKDWEERHNAVQSK